MPASPNSLMRTVLAGGAAAALLAGCSSGPGPVTRHAMTAPPPPSATAASQPVAATAPQGRILPDAPLSRSAMADALAQARVEVGRIVQAIDVDPAAVSIVSDDRLMRAAAAVEALQTHLEDYMTGQLAVSPAPLNDTTDIQALLRCATRTSQAIAPLLVDLQRLHEDQSTVDGPGSRMLASRSAHRVRQSALTLNRELAQLQHSLQETRPAMIAGVMP